MLMPLVTSRLFAATTVLALTAAMLVDPRLRRSQADVAVDPATITRDAIERFAFDYLSQRYGIAYASPPVVDLAASVARVASVLGVEPARALERAAPRRPHVIGVRDSLERCSGQPGTSSRRCVLSPSKIDVISVARVVIDSTTGTLAVWTSLLFTINDSGDVRDYTGEVLFRRTQAGDWIFDKIGRVLHE